MGFSGMRAVIMVVMFVALILAVTKLDMPGWILPVGLIVTGILLNSVKVTRASA
jgi:hypothetical protein